MSVAGLSSLANESCSESLFLHLYHTGSCLGFLLAVTVFQVSS